MARYNSPANHHNSFNKFRTENITTEDENYFLKHKKKFYENELEEQCSKHSREVANKKYLLKDIEDLKTKIIAYKDQEDIWKKQIEDLRGENDNLREMKEMVEKNNETLVRKTGNESIQNLTRIYDERVNE